MLKLTPADCSYALHEVGSPKIMVFGDRPWEACLVSQESYLGRTSLGSIMLKRINEAHRRSAEGARMLRTLLTIVFAPVYHGMDLYLPRISGDHLAGIESLYPRTDQGRSALELEALTAAQQVSPEWSELIEKYKEWLVGLDQRYFVFACLKLLIEEAEEDLKDEQINKTIKSLDRPAQDPIRNEKTYVERSEEQLNRPLEFVPATGVTFGDVGGCHAAKDRLIELARLLMNPEVAARWGVDLPRGVMLYGPPGSGKTLMVKALAAHTARPLASVKTSDVVTLWKGESVRHLKKYFDAARAKKGAILFFDEADGLIFDRRRPHLDKGDQQMVTEFNMQMESIKNEDRLLVVLATNFKEDLDEAAVRDQRIDMTIPVSLPDHQERIEIFQVHIAAAARKAARPLFSGSVALAELAAMTGGLSGAALASIIERTIRGKVSRELQGYSPSLIIQADLETSVRERLAERKKSEKRRIGFDTTIPPLQEPITIEDEDDPLIDLLS